MNQFDFQNLRDSRKVSVKESCSTSDSVVQVECGGIENRYLSGRLGYARPSRCESSSSRKRIPERDAPNRDNSFGVSLTRGKYYITKGKVGGYTGNLECYYVIFSR